MKKKNFKDAEKFLLSILKPKLVENFSFFRLSIKNGHPFIYYTPYYSKTESVTLNFFNNNKIRIYTISMFEYIKNDCFIYAKNKSSSEIIKDIKEIVNTNISFPYDDYFFYENYKDNISKLKKEIRKVVRKNLIHFFINEILYKRNISNLYVNGNYCLCFHFKNYYTKDYGTVIITDNYIKLVKRESKDNSKEKKKLYMIDITNYILNDRLQVSFLEKELKELKKKIKIYF